MILPGWRGAATAPAASRGGGSQGAKPALALISVPQQGRRLDTTPP
jgi:hypothetical protein